LSQPAIHLDGESATFGEKTEGIIEVENQKGNMKHSKDSSILERIAKVLDPLCRICKVCFDLWVMVHGR
jgi:hypothetical protein